jgi:hypothetical protein
VSWSRSRVTTVAEFTHAKAGCKKRTGSYSAYLPCAFACRNRDHSVGNGKFTKALLVAGWYSSKLILKLDQSLASCPLDRRHHNNRPPISGSVVLWWRTASPGSHSKGRSIARTISGESGSGVESAFTMRDVFSLEVTRRFGYHPELRRHEECALKKPGTGKPEREKQDTGASSKPSRSYVWGLPSNVDEGRNFICMSPGRTLQKHPQARISLEVLRNKVVAYWK